VRIGVTPVLVLAVACATPGLAGVGAWTPLGPDGAQMVSLAVDPRSPSFVYAGTVSGGVFRSRNGGASWVNKSSGLGTGAGFPQAFTLAVAPHDSAVLYAATERGVFKSTDRAGQCPAASTWPRFSGFNAATTSAAAGASCRPSTAETTRWPSRPEALRFSTPEHPNR